MGWPTSSRAEQGCKKLVRRNLFLMLFLRDRVLLIFVANAGLGPWLLLPQTPECWDCRHVPPPPHPAGKRFYKRNFVCGQVGCGRGNYSEVSLKIELHHIIQTQDFLLVTLQPHFPLERKLFSVNMLRGFDFLMPAFLLFQPPLELQLPPSYRLHIISLILGFKCYCRC